MEAVATVSIGVRLLAHMMPWVFVRLFPTPKLDSLLEVFPMPTGEAVELDHLGRRATCWLHIVNLTPFEVQVDRLEVTIVADGLSVTIQKNLPEVIPSLRKAHILCRGSFSVAPEALQLALKSTKVRVDVQGYAICSARSFLFNRSFSDLRGFRISG